jgi:hypothetical protein
MQGFSMKSFSISISTAVCLAIFGTWSLAVNSGGGRATDAASNQSQSINIAMQGKATASSEWQHSYPASAANDGDRYSCGPGQYWRGAKGESPWTWQIDFAKPKRIAKVYQIMGSEPYVRRFAPTDYLWQRSNNGTSWHDIPGSAVTGDTRIFRVVEFAAPVRARHFRMRITAATDGAPSLREIEMFASSGDDVKSDPWFYAINIEGSIELPGYAKNFVPTAQQCAGWEKVQAQYVQAKDFKESILQPEPRPLCAFLSGSTRDWCEVDRRDYEGVEEVLRNRNLPMWASCGGSQLLLLLTAYGTKVPWICPHCEWNRPDYYKTAPQPFIYGHLHCEGHPKCSEYDKVMERGDYDLKKLLPDPALSGVPDLFNIAESHEGEIKWLPGSWVLIATKGPKGLTVNQIMRVRNRYIYAAQCHIELGGRDRLALCKNFLDLAKSWGGYNPNGKNVADPAHLNDDLAVKQ